MVPEYTSSSENSWFVFQVNSVHTEMYRSGQVFICGLMDIHENIELLISLQAKEAKGVGCVCGGGYTVA